MARESEDWVVLRDGTPLFEKTWTPASSPTCHLIFLHGFSDRSEIQYHLFPTLAAPPYNITCHAIDQRGWGKSVQHPSHRGLTGPSTQVLSDIDEYVRHVSTTKIRNLDLTPLFIMGHSMGGQLILHYLLSTSRSLTSRSVLSGAIIEAPYIALDPSSQPSALLVIAGKLAAMVTPKSQMKQHLDSRYITRDPEVNRQWKDDPLCHDHGTLEGLRDMLQRGADLVALSALPNNASVAQISRLGLGLHFPVPVFWAHGTDDKVTSFDASRRLFERIRHDSGQSVGDSAEKVQFRAYERAYHKIHAEPDGVGVAFSKDVGDWVLAVVQSRQRNEPAESKRKGSVETSLDVSTDAVVPEEHAQQEEETLKAKL